MTCAQHRSAWSAAKSAQSSLSARLNLWSLATNGVYSSDRSDWADTHDDLTHPWDPSHFDGFVIRWLIWQNTPEISKPINYKPTSAVAQLLERPFCILDDPRPSHTKDFKIGTSYIYASAQHWQSQLWKHSRSGHCFTKTPSRFGWKVGGSDTEPVKSQNKSSNFLLSCFAGWNLSYGSKLKAIPALARVLF